jgi:hypothetical protein
MSEHLARHVLERVHAADPRGRANPVAHVHLTECDRCAVRKRALEAAHAGYFALHPVEAFTREVLARASVPEPQLSRFARLQRGLRKVWLFKQKA